MNVIRFALLVVALAVIVQAKSAGPLSQLKGKDSSEDSSEDSHEVVKPPKDSSENSSGEDSHEGGVNPPKDSSEDVSNPAPGEACDERCNTTGYCQHYDRCQNGVIVRDLCVEGLFWNPLDKDGNDNPHGGNCDHYEDISKAVLDRYHADPECLECKLEEIEGGCNNQYHFRAYGATSTHVSILSCGDDLVFSNAKQTCVTRAQYGGDCA